MKLKRIGFFRELRHGMPEAQQINSLVSEKPQENEELIINYLKEGVLFIATTGFVEDVLKPGQLICCPHILTDGVWAWPADLAYYVEKYHVQLPNEFVKFMKGRNWIVPDQDIINFSRLEF